MKIISKSFQILELYDETFYFFNHIVYSFHTTLMSVFLESSTMSFQINIIWFNVFKFEQKKLFAFCFNKKQINNLNFSKWLFQVTFQQMMTYFLNKSISFCNKLIHYFDDKRKHWIFRRKRYLKQNFTQYIYQLQWFCLHFWTKFRYVF